jgi:hypothetical protein
MSIVGPSGLFVFNGISCAMLAFYAARAMGQSRHAQPA